MTIEQGFTVASELRDACRLGIIEIAGVRVQETPDELKRLFDELAARCTAEYGSMAPGDIPAIQAVRALFHRTGIDPTRYRPSSESLLRRVVKGKGLYFINSAVDAANYCSLRTLLPMGLYNAGQVVPPVSFRVGQEGETYQGIGRDMLNLHRFPVLADGHGPFGSPISDSMRTRVTPDCERLLWVTFVPPAGTLDLDALAEVMVRFNGGVVEASTEL